jgi:diguanylate cyclase (GGDEF)-like protein
VQRFTDSEKLDACPKLRGRTQGSCSAVCVPVSIMGRTVGVIHAVGETDVSFDEDRVHDLGTLANLAGARIGLLRVMAETQLQAATDNLTGLMNRRTLENAAQRLRSEGTPFTVAMADLDHFKELNDKYGHETGDRALRVFARSLQSAVRTQDLVGRHGGEEFVIVFPHCTAEQARRVLDAARMKLETAVVSAGLPPFTVSFGVVEAAAGDTFATVVSGADAALFHAKRNGRDRIVVHDEAGLAVDPVIDDEDDEDEMDRTTLRAVTSTSRRGGRAGAPAIS